MCAVSELFLQLLETDGPEDELIEHKSCSDRTTSFAGEAKIDKSFLILTLIRLARLDGIKDVMDEFVGETFESR